MTDDRLDSALFRNAIAQGRNRFGILKKRYPALHGYLVMAWLGDQVGIDVSLEEAIAGFPDILADGNMKSAAVGLLKELRIRKLSNAEWQCRNDRFQKLCERLEFNGKVRIEIRFNNLDFELISSLRTDDLVDQDITPQTTASIRIVLGSLRGLSVPTPVKA